MILNHPIYKKAYLHHEIEQVTKAFCESKNVHSAVIQILIKSDKMVITIKTSSSGEATALKLVQDELFTSLEQILTEKKLWEEKDLVLIVKLK